VNCCVALVATEAVAGETTTETGLSVTVAVADFVVSATDVACTLAVETLATLAGAVYKPLDESVPSPVSDQVTAVLAVPVTVAVNCCVPPPPSEAEVGEIDTEIAAGGFSVTVAEADLVVSFVEVAVTVAVDVAVIVAGAV
jgi:hypothetical protein